MLTSGFGAMVGYVTLVLPLVVILRTFSLAAIDRSLIGAAGNPGASPCRAMRSVVIPCCLPALISAYCLTAAVSFDEFIVDWFVSGLNKTVPVTILEILQDNVDPQINPIGTVVFLISMTLVIVAQLLIL